MANCVPPLSAVSFLAISAFFELLCVLLYAYVFPKLAIVKYYYSKADLAAGGIETLLQPEVCHLYLSILVPFV
jgi:hypothetical protein